ncbi:hypothetical protein HMPREF1155_1215 [Slackia sp. CM382]|nr:hypothetical protein HMPREF1155_1215 [Slackia sp. CM382]
MGEQPHEPYLYHERTSYRSKREPRPAARRTRADRCSPQETHTDSSPNARRAPQAFGRRYHCYRQQPARSSGGIGSSPHARRAASDGSYSPVCRRIGTRAAGNVPARHPCRSSKSRHAWRICR